MLHERIFLVRQDTTVCIEGIRSRYVLKNSMLKSEARLLWEPGLAISGPILPSDRQHTSYDDCLEVMGEYCQNCSVLGCVHNVHSQQHTRVSSSYRSSWLGLSHWNPYPVRRGGCLELYYCNMVEWSWSDSSLTCKNNWLPSVLWHCWFGHMTCKIRPRYDL